MDDIPIGWDWQTVSDNNESTCWWLRLDPIPQHQQADCKACGSSCGSDQFVRGKLPQMLVLLNQPQATIHYAKKLLEIINTWNRKHVENQENWRLLHRVTTLYNKKCQRRLSMGRPHMLMTPGDWKYVYINMYFQLSGVTSIDVNSFCRLWTETPKFGS